MTINIFYKATVSCEDSLDPGPEARAGLRRGVPGEEPHHLLYLLDQIIGCVARLCIDPCRCYTKSEDMSMGFLKYPFYAPDPAIFPSQFALIASDTYPLLQLKYYGASRL